MPDDNDAAPRFTPDWITCTHDTGGCAGRKVEEFEQCLAHLTAKDLDTALRRFIPGIDLDLRGTTLTAGLLHRLLAGMSEGPATSSPHLGRADFRHCHFTVDDVQHTGEVTLDGKGVVWQFDGARFGGAAMFDHARFDGYIRFTGAQFSEEAWFVSAQFNELAVFDGAKFDGDANFDDAQFGGGVSLVTGRFSSDANFDDARFVGDANFERTRFDGHTRFIEAEFGGDAWFSDAIFGELVRFDSTQFHGATNFSNTRFIEAVNFGGARFSGDTWFDGTQLDGRVMFDNVQFGMAAGFHGVRFGDQAGFDGARFNGSTTFIDARFGGAARFIGTRFGGGTWFDNTRFDGMAAFSNAWFGGEVTFGPLVTSSLRLNRASFTKRVVIEAETAELSANEARFEDGVELRARHAKVSLQRTFFGAPSSLSGALAPFKSSKGMLVTADQEQINTWTATQDDTNSMNISSRAARLEEWVPQLLSVQETDVSQLTLADIDLRWCRFAGVHQLDKLRVEGRGPFNRPPGWGVGWVWPPVWRWTSRRVLAEEHPWRAGRSKPKGWSNDLPSLDGVAAVPAVNPERLAVLYRSLRKAFEDAKNEAGAGDFYYGEMEARRHAPSTSRAERILLTTYWMLSGYGQRASRALAALVVLIGLLFVLLTTHGLPESSVLQQMEGTLPAAATGQPQQITLEVKPSAVTLPPPERRWTTDRLGKAIRIALGSVVFRDADQRLTPAGMWTVMAGRAFGPLLLALAALAIRARVKR